MKKTSIAETIQLLAKQELSPQRYAHSRRMIKFMENLNNRLFLNIDLSLLEIMGWAHDIAKEWPKDRLYSAIQKYHRENYLVTHAHPPLWHAIVAMPYIQEKCQFYNEEIDQAIIHHPTAQPHASILSKLLFIADENEAGRSHLGSDHFLMIDYASLKDFYLFTIQNIITFLSQKNQTISSLTLEAYQAEKELMQKQLQTFYQNPFKENTYLFFTEETLLIVDPGVKLEQIAPAILAYSPNNVKILYTHGHFDHIIFGSSLEQFLDQHQIPYQSYASKEDIFYFGEDGVKHIQEVIQMYGIGDFYSCHAVPKIDHFLEDQDSIGCLDFTFHHTPGHTKGSGLFHSKKENILFTGDTLFANGSIGRTDFPDSSPEAMELSLKKIFSNIAPETIIYPGHAIPSTIEKERKIHQNLF